MAFWLPRPFGSIFGPTAALVAALLVAAPAQANTATLEAERQAVFAQLLTSPADPALMLQYAQLSVRLRDFEAAAATLERYVDLFPGNAGARLELAIAYFSLGAYDVAEYHLAAVASSGALTQEQLERVGAYRDEGAARSEAQTFTVRLAFGTAWTSTANETGSFGSAALEWRIDLGDANATQWLTEFAYSSFLPGDQSFNDRRVARLRTGPEFRLTGETYGPRLQPYVEVEALRNDLFGVGEYNAVAFGLAYQNPHNATWTSFADMQAGQARALNFGSDFDFRDVTAGAIFRPSRATQVRGSVNWRVEDQPFQDITTHGIRLEAQHSFMLGADSLPRHWEARAFVDRRMVETDTGFFVTEVVDTAIGASLRAFVTEDVFIEARASQLERENLTFPNVQNETVYALQIGWEF